MLVIVKYGDVEFGFQAFFDSKTGRRGNVLQVDRAKTGGYRLDSSDNLILRVDIEDNWHAIDICEVLEQQSFAFHDRHSGARTDIS